ncbi:MAG: biosynthetic arginine decarboxylase [Planctomycetaceae bacterium]
MNQHPWSVRDSHDLYSVSAWGSGFFSVGEAGNVVVHPKRAEGASIDLKLLVDDLLRRGYELPLLLRFSDILSSRVREISECFEKAIQEYGYKGSYRGVYPIKVNQQRHIVEELLACGRPWHLGLEVGSKPEMLVALAVMEDAEGLILCNGYKDEAYVETALLSQKLGRTTVLVVDRFRELELILRVARRIGVRPNIGVRAKLQARGAGRWAESTGGRSKFGLTASEIVEAARLLKAEGMLDCLQLLHFHIGSQIPAIRVFKEALREASRIFVELHALGAQMRFFDVGGGLAVDYDGSNTNFHSSMNYSVQEYANDVVSVIAEACDALGVPHPILVTESGRALVAHHAVLVFNVLDTNEILVKEKPEEPAENDHEVVQKLYETWKSISRRQLLEPYHDAIQLRDEASQHFTLGYLDLVGRARAERLFNACCAKLHKHLREVGKVPEELEGLEQALADTYYCNFSVFQSMPDSWAVGQLFPLMPIHRLQEQPTRQATFVDLTCDSDGKVDSFIDPHDVKEVLELHAPNGQPYYLGVFLVGAYQEILGDLHNLFGDTNAIHVALDGDRYSVEHVVVGDTVSEVLSYVEFDRRDLLRRVRRYCEDAFRAGKISLEETALLLKRYESGLDSYTYLSESPAATPAPAEPGNGDEPSARTRAAPPPGAAART